MVIERGWERVDINVYVNISVLFIWLTSEVLIHCSSSLARLNLTLAATSHWLVFALRLLLTLGVFARIALNSQKGLSLLFFL